MASLPTGTVTFLFTDIEGSTRLATTLGDGYESLLARHRDLLNGTIGANDGHAFGSEGDAIFAAFGRPRDAIAAALEAQRALAAERWPAKATIRVRIGIHTGDARAVDGNYVGIALHEAARICSAGNGGQILVSPATAELASDALPSGATLKRLGEYRLKDLPQAIPLFELQHPEMPDRFPPLRAQAVAPTNLPGHLASFVGRTTEQTAIAEALERDRLVTILGPGGVGKTRLAIAAGADARTSYAQGVWLVDLAPLVDANHVSSAVSQALGFEGKGEAGLTIADQIDISSMLLIFDNCEHVIDGARSAAELILAACPNVSIIATSQRPLEATAETVFPLSPMGIDDAAGGDAIALFIERAQKHDATFSADDAERRTIADICRRLDGLPLAIELAAAHVRALTLEQIGARIEDRFAFLTKSSRTADDRLKTLRSAIDWGYGLLDDKEAELLARLSVFSGGFTLDAAEGVCAGDGIEPDEIYPLLASLVDRSFTVFMSRGKLKRYFLLETIREYGSEKLAAMPAVAPAGYSIQLRGDAWMFDGHGEDFALKDSKGLRYLAHLIMRPGDEVFVLDLLDMADGASATDSATRRAIGSAGEASDRTALAAYRERLVALQVEREEAREWNDDARGTALDEQIAALTEEVSRAVNISGGIRSSGSTIERARTSVTKAIRSAVARIAAQDPDLGKQLESSIRTGTRCAYEPAADLPSIDIGGL